MGSKPSNYTRFTNVKRSFVEAYTKYRDREVLSAKDKAELRNVVESISIDGILTFQDHRGLVTINGYHPEDRIIYFWDAKNGWTSECIKEEDLKAYLEFCRSLPAMRELLFGKYLSYISL